MGKWQPKAISRREFLKVFGANVALFALPLDVVALPTLAWPEIRLKDLPSRIGEILDLVPQTYIGKNGILYDVSNGRDQPAPVPLAQTLWNQQNSKPYHRLYTHVPWGIVLHWYGDKSSFDTSVKGYLRGFDSLRQMDGIEGRTSAHFLVGGGAISQRLPQPGAPIGILQTQSPDVDGNPFLASHIKPLDIVGHREKKQYFVRAFYQLATQDPAVHSLLQSMFDGPLFDPNMRTIAIEITGFNFDAPENTPSAQKIANVLSVVWALMKRYQIPASSLLGHQEIQLGKADPGKKFLALIRYLLAVKALLDRDPQMLELVFGQFARTGSNLPQSAKRYFNFLRSYLIKISTPRQVYAWEIEAQYWRFLEMLFGSNTCQYASSWIPTPVQEPVAQIGYRFLEPVNHEGIDIYPRDPSGHAAAIGTAPVLLAADGVCLSSGAPHGRSGGHAIFQHRQLNGADVLSVYTHLDWVDRLQVGRIYAQGYPLGGLEKVPGYRDPFLHYAIAYGATWESDLERNIRIPSNTGPTWIRDRYLHPDEFLQQQYDPVPDISGRQGIE